MRLADARTIANAAIERHLPGQGWSFAFDNSRRRFGCCNYNKKQITLSKHLVHLNSEGVVNNTILHEVAHAMAPRGSGHNVVWRRQAQAIGCTGQRCYNASTVKLPPHKYIGVCPNCNKQTKALRRNQVACAVCCRLYNGNRYTERFKIRWSG